MINSVLHDKIKEFRQLGCPQFVEKRRYKKGTRNSNENTRRRRRRRLYLEREELVPGRGREARKRDPLI